MSQDTGANRPHRRRHRRRDGEQGPHAADRRRRRGVPHPDCARARITRLHRHAPSARSPRRWRRPRAPPAFAVLDLRLGDGNGLELVGPLRQARPDIRIVVLTGYGNIATAVAAVKEGAVDYLAKPADADAIEQALTAHGRKLPPPPEQSDVGRPRALGAYPARLRAVRPQRLGDRAPPQHAPPHLAAHPRQARAPRALDPVCRRGAPLSGARQRKIERHDLEYGAERAGEVCGEAFAQWHRLKGPVCMDFRAGQCP